MAKESLLDRLRSKPTDVLDEEGKLRKELLELKIKHLSLIHISEPTRPY